ncbi:hypothetical protein PV620_26905 [Streptomyces sp. ME02-6978a]|uniref:hypothetical protein n=1 Tax=unclassified Streptomyces TaxID=2593676 RepID=UPI0029B4EA6B|nr:MULTISPECIES: hypothetical protein [unclassified Streptomyces]MDX3092570.1 hypothetical protein [Streptomyces sp. ME12-02E]MDX3335175.1 hypothetical protein [Streptomyces sp. ME02-6978a]
MCPGRCSRFRAGARGGYSFASEDGFRTALLIGGGLALVSALIAAVIPAVRGGEQGGPGAAPTAPAKEAAVQG